jgi:Uma2 family endonuclease
MSTAPKRNLIGVDDYLTDELTSPIKHDFFGGRVYARPDTTNRHKLIVANVIGALHRQLLGKTCRVWNFDTKIRIHLPNETRFYYPDASVSRRSNPQSDSFQDEPVVVIEVLSPETRRIDEWEKKDAYLTSPSLGVYILLEQETAAAVVFRRTASGFIREVYEGMDAVISLGEVDAAMPLAEAYEGVEFSPEAAST